MKKIAFVGDSLRALRAFPEPAKQEAGYQLHLVQNGLQPTDWKPMANVGQGVQEIRVHANGEFRVIYVAKFENTVYVLRAFQKKTQKTPKSELEAVRKAYRSIVETRK